MADHSKNMKENDNIDNPNDGSQSTQNESNHSKTPEIVLDLAQLYQNRNKTFNECVQSVYTIPQVVDSVDENGHKAQSIQYIPLGVQENDLLELRIACFPQLSYITKMYLCGFLDEEQANEAVEIEKKLLADLQDSLADEEVVDVSNHVSPFDVFSKLSLPFTKEMVDDYLYRIDRISMVASLIDLNNKNILKRKADFQNSLPRPNIFSQAPDETAGCCHVLEELMLIRNELHLTSGTTEALLSQAVSTLYFHEVGQMLKDVPEHPLNRGVHTRAAYMNIYFQMLLREPDTKYDNKTLAENLLQAIDSVRSDVLLNKVANPEEIDLSEFGDTNVPWQEVFATSMDKAFLDVKKFYNRVLSDIHRKNKIASQNTVTKNRPNQGHGKVD